MEEKNEFLERDWRNQELRNTDHNGERPIKH